MKKIIMMAVICITTLMGGSFDDGVKAYINGNKQKAKYLFGKACNSGIMGGCNSLGAMYYKGDGVRQDKRKAKDLFGKACDGGYMEGCNNLGFLYYNGDGVRQNKRKAKELYGKACDGGVMIGCKSYKILNEEGY